MERLKPLRFHAFIRVLKIKHGFYVFEMVCGTNAVNFVWTLSLTEYFPVKPAREQTG